jgi:hypothetical protein
MNGPAQMRVVAWVQLTTAGGLLLYWSLFFTIGLAPSAPPPGYFAFQHSFTFPDIILALAFVRAGILLLSAEIARRDRGRDLSLICASALLFLGLLDVSFNLQNGIYATRSIDTVLEIAVNVWCIGLSSCWLLSNIDAWTPLCRRRRAALAMIPSNG